MTKYLLSLVAIYILYIALLGVMMFRRRKKAIIDGRIRVSYFKSYQEEFPYDLKVIQNHFENQFQVPVLFFITVLAIIQVKAESFVTVSLGTLFVLSRLLHSYIHLGRNNVIQRAFVFFSGVIILLLTWIFILVS